MTDAFSSAVDATSKPLSTVLRSALLGRFVRWPTSAPAAETARFLDMTLRQGVQPLLHHQLQASGSLPSWPEHVRAALRGESRRQTVVAAILQLELRRVLDALADREVFPLLMKGVPLSHTHYPSPGLRPCSDTDLLIEAADVGTTGRVLTALGYSRLNTIEGDLVSAQAVYRKHDANGVVHDLDVHWKISNPRLFADCLSYAELAGRASPLTALGEHARGLGAMHALLLSCIHRVAHHHEERLIWLYDIHRLVNSMEGEALEEFARLATDKQVAALCVNGVARAIDWFDTPVPPGLRRAWATLRGRSEPSERFLAPGLRRVDILLSDLGELSVRGRLGLLRQHVFPRSDYMLRRYGRSNRCWLPALYLDRGVRGIWRWFTPLAPSSTLPGGRDSWIDEPRR